MRRQQQQQQPRGSSSSVAQAAVVAGKQLRSPCSPGRLAFRSAVHGQHTCRREDGRLWPPALLRPGFLALPHPRRHRQGRRNTEVAMLVRSEGVSYTCTLQPNMQPAYFCPHCKHQTLVKLRPFTVPKHSRSVRSSSSNGDSIGSSRHSSSGVQSSREGHMLLRSVSQACFHRGGMGMSPPPRRRPAAATPPRRLAALQPRSAVRVASWRTASRPRSPAIRWPACEGVLGTCSSGSSSCSSPHSAARGQKNALFIVKFN